VAPDGYRSSSLFDVRFSLSDFCLPAVDFPKRARPACPTAIFIHYPSFNLDRGRRAEGKGMKERERERDRSSRALLMSRFYPCVQLSSHGRSRRATGIQMRQSRVITSR